MSGVANRRDRRVSMSFSPEQVIWLTGILATLQRGGDATIIARHEHASELLSLFGKARVRAEELGPKAPPRILDRCRNGHAYTADNVYMEGESRRCRICLRATRLRAKARQDQMIEDFARKKAG